jgi:hypothetical protein
MATPRVGETEMTVTLRCLMHSEATFFQAIQEFDAISVRQQAEPKNENLAAELARAQVYLDFARGAKERAVSVSADIQARIFAADYPISGTLHDLRDFYD